MLPTFNEILFKMPSADSLRFHVEIQLEELFEKVCLSLPVFVVSVWNPPQYLNTERSFSPVTG